MGSVNKQQIPSFLDKTVSFPDGRTYEILEPLTDFRKCHDGRPLEARIVFTCKQVLPQTADSNDTEYVMKVKVQAPDPSWSSSDPDDNNHDSIDQKQQHPGPSTTTLAELKALEVFNRANSPSTPHLVAFRTATQGPTGLLPGGYLSFLVMTKMPGQDLLALQFWNNDRHSEPYRAEVVAAFLSVLRSVYALGVEPVDCALRNVLWEEETKTCSIIDFELWREATPEGFGTDERKELERWGLARRKAPVSWWAEWQISGH